MFAQMKFAIQADRQRVNAPVLARGDMPQTLNVSAAEVLKFATIDGARALGLESKVGSLTPGKQADIVMIRATDINLTPVNDPIGAVVLSAHTGNVDSVFVAGRAVKRGGRLLDVNMGRISTLAAKTRDYIFAEYGVPEGAWPQQYRAATTAQS